MDDIQARLKGCFQLVFPDLTEPEIPGASEASVAGWDSLAAITLVNVIEDEFGVALDLADLPSFERILEVLRAEAQAA